MSYLNYARYKFSIVRDKVGLGRSREQLKVSLQAETREQGLSGYSRNIFTDSSNILKAIGSFRSFKVSHFFGFQASDFRFYIADLSIDFFY